MASHFLKTEFPIIQAPMAGAQDIQLAIAVAKAGGLGSLPCAMLNPEQIRGEVAKFRAATQKPLNLNFFCHQAPPAVSSKEAAWRKLLEPYYREFKVDPNLKVNSPSRSPFDVTLCALVEELKPEVVSFHFGLPSENLLARVKKVAMVIASATTVAEGVWLEAHGCDAVIAQGLEAGGHRGNFLSDDLGIQMGTFSLVPLLADALKVPVIASGGISDERGAKAAMILGAKAIQVGTSYLFCPEAKISAFHKEKLSEKYAPTALTNLFSGRPARGIVNRLMKDLGAMNSLVPEFPLAGGALAPLKEAAGSSEKGDFSSLWAGQSASLNKPRSAKEITEALGKSALQFSN
ncbi:2-nitropropane dioxygenase [Bdellovibrio bacteriovorus]|uniref:Nitronate monooxygenase n=1 Tax=Bdellovibrio bacteriovorus TaxID=959 RepID=A0A150WH53_BDEBC|nr:nitronate monooxygenase [Bdellovibrio bacteriovorus]KYG62427.1 2-nitropropane dioxygenase [Bdellovibrio bacteriovorus]